MYYIYKIENLKNHKKYIGLTNNYKRRKLRHFSDLERNVHDNSFLQQEYNKYGKNNFSFEIVFEGDVTPTEIGEKEKEFISYYDSYRNGYNQNSGGNFGPSNGGSHLIQSDIFCILSTLEFMSRPGQVLSDIYNVSRTTISRIKKGINHNEFYNEYWNKPLEERQRIYKIFCEQTNFYEKKVNSTIINNKRKLTKDQVFIILYNDEYKITTKKSLMKKFNINSGYTFDCILNNKSYKDYALEYSKLNNEQKNKISVAIKQLIVETH